MLSRRKILIGLVAAPVVIQSGILMPLRGEILKPVIKPVFFYGGEYEGRGIKVTDRYEEIVDNFIKTYNLPDVIKPDLEALTYYCSDIKSMQEVMIETVKICSSMDDLKRQTQSRTYKRVKIEPVKGRGLSVRETIQEAMRIHNV